MITDASNSERDQINAMAQERRAKAGELGAHRVTLPEKPYGLASGDEIVFTGQYRIPGEQRVENGITGTILNVHRGESRVTIKTKEREPREVDVDTSEFADISLAYAVHVHKGQGLTAETSGILTGACLWQTDRGREPDNPAQLEPPSATPANPTIRTATPTSTRRSRKRKTASKPTSATTPKTATTTTGS